MQQATQKLHTLWDSLFTGAPVELGVTPRRCLLLALRTLACLLLSLGQLGGACDPGGVCLLAASGGGAAGLAALAGGWAGAFGYWGFAEGLEPAAAAILVFAGSYLLEGTGLAKKPGFPAVLCGCMTALAGVLSLAADLQLETALRWMALTAAAAAGAGCFGALLRQPSIGAALLPSALAIAGLTALPLPGGLTVGAVASTALGYLGAVRTGSCALAVACGLGLELGMGGSGGLAAALSLAALLAARMRTGEAPPRAVRFLRPLAFLAALTAGSLLWAGGDAALVLAGLPTLLLALPLGKLPWETWAAPRPVQTAAASTAPPPSLSSACAALEELQALLSAQVREDRETRELERMFDDAASQACRDCGRWGRCWREKGPETYQILCRAARPMVARGHCCEEDLPDSFAAACRRPGTFSQAVDQALQLLLCRRGCRRRLEGGLAVYTEQTEILAAFLRRAAEAPEPAGQVRYIAQVAVRAKGKAAPSGDRGASIRRGTTQYVLLCDGMGTGGEAAEEASAAISILSRLLEAGMAPGEAVALLSGAYLLRETTAFATVDLLELDLERGEGVLYKWGAAPSYLRRGGTVRKIGTASPPPGLCAGQARQAEGVRLSFGEDGMLVMLSDGAAGEAALRAVRAFGTGEPADLAAQIIADTARDAGESGEVGEVDDRTVIVVRLHPRCAGQTAAHPAADLSVLDYSI